MSRERVRGRGPFAALSLLGMLVIASVATSCATGSESPSSSRAVTPPESPSLSSGSASAAPGSGAGSVWVAALKLADDPDELDGDTAQLKPLLGRALIVSPSDCFQGLPPEADTTYLLGVVGTSSAEVDDLVAKSGRPALFTAEVRLACTD